MEKAIKRALEGGWSARYTHSFYQFNDPQTKNRKVPITSILLDKLFWQALGKVEGWDEGCVNDEEYKLTKYSQVWMWKHKWHQLIDHIAEGKDIDSFFNGLLK